MEKKDFEGFSPPNYGNLNFDGGSVKSPSAPANNDDSEFEGAAEVLNAPTAPPYVSTLQPRTLTYDPPSLNYEDIHEACIRYVQEHCFYSSRFLRQMALTEIKNDSAFHYALETFCERRESALTSDPYIGQFIDGPENGPPPAPWDIPVQPPALFLNGKVKTEIPHTAYVKPCPDCVGNGRVRCESCHGRGGRGTGQNRSRCYKCSGTGQVQCKKCDGRGNVKLYRILIVTWMNFTEEFMSNMHNLPEKYLKTVTGNRMLFEEDQLLTPIATAPDESINQASASIMERQREAFQNMRILKQRHVLRAIPLTKVFYAYRGKDGEFYVYGQERNVYFQKYPQRCCCCTCL